MRKNLVDILEGMVDFTGKKQKPSKSNPPLVGGFEGDDEGYQDAHREVANAVMRKMNVSKEDFPEYKRNVSDAVTNAYHDEHTMLSWQIAAENTLRGSKMKQGVTKMNVFKK